MPERSLIASQRHCADVTRRAGSNFVATFRLLPPQKRVAMGVLYAFMRITDDLADDESLDTTTRQIQLAHWRDAVLANSIPNNSVITPTLASGLKTLPAVRWLVETFRVPQSSLQDAITGADSDLVPQRFATFSDAAEYCHLVATSAGVASLAIWGTRVPLNNQQLIKAAEACGLAFQWTNILRDVAEDSRRGRLYLPTEELAAYGLAADEVVLALTHGQQQFTASLRAFLDAQFIRCEELFCTAATLTPLIDSDSQRLFLGMMGTYHTLLKKMQRHPEAILTSRVRLSLCDKVGVAWRVLFASRTF